MQKCQLEMTTYDMNEKCNNNREQYIMHFRSFQ